MPQVRKQVVAANNKVSLRPAVSILDEAVDVSELQDGKIKMVIYGENRVGKTTLACDFPKPLLLIALEPNKTGGALSVRKIEGVKYLRLDSVEKFVRLAGEVESAGKFATVVIDSATSLQDLILKEILNLPEVPEMLTWGTASRDQYRERSERTREALRPYINLSCHTVVTAKQKDHNPPKDEKPRITKGLQLESFFAADLGGATVGWLHDACDFICQLSIQKEVVTRRITVGQGKQQKVIEREEETGRTIRRLRTMYHPNFAAGFRSDTPEAVPEYIDHPTFAKIQSVMNGEPLT